MGKDFEDAPKDVNEYQVIDGSRDEAYLKTQTAIREELEATNLNESIKILQSIEINQKIIIQILAEAYNLPQYTSKDL